jgi:hypothetical protein
LVEIESKNKIKTFQKSQKAFNKDSKISLKIGFEKYKKNQIRRRADELHWLKSRVKIPKHELHWLKSRVKIPKHELHWLKSRVKIPKHFKNSQKNY